MGLKFDKIVKSDVRRWAVVAGLVVTSFMSTSYGKGQCFSSFIEMPKTGVCGSKALKAKLEPIAGKIYSHKMLGRWAKFVVPRDAENFYAFDGGKRVQGQACCSGGSWSVAGYSIRKVEGGLKIGAFTFTEGALKTSAIRSSQQVQMADTSEATAGFEQNGLL